MGDEKLISSFFVNYAKKRIKTHYKSFWLSLYKSTVLVDKKTKDKETAGLIC